MPDNFVVDDSPADLLDRRRLLMPRYQYPLSGEEVADIDQRLTDVRTALRDGTAPVLASGSTTRRTLGEHLWGLKPSWDDRTAPWVCGRTAEAAPNDTLYSFDLAVAANSILEVDVYALADQTLITHHNANTLTDTGVSLDLNRARIDDVRALRGTHVGFDPAVYPWQPIPSLNEVLARYGRLVPMMLEAKGGLNVGTLLAQAVKRFGLERNVVLSTFSTVAGAQIRAVDPSLRVVLNAGGSGVDQSTMPTPAFLTENGYWGVGAYWNNSTADYIASVKAAGLKFFSWPFSSLGHAESIVALGADGFYSDAAPYHQELLGRDTPTLTAVAPWVNIKPSHWRLYRSNNPSTPAAVSTDGYATFNETGTPSGVYLIYPGMRAPEGTWTVDMQLKLVKASATPADIIGFRWGFASDLDVTFLGRPSSEGAASNGYYVAYAADGSIGLRRVTGQAFSSIGGASGWPTLSEGSTVTLRVAVTSTTITITNLTGGGQTFTVTESSNAQTRRGFLSAFGNGQVPGLGNITLTY